MKKLNYILIMLSLILIFSSCRKEDRSAELHTDSTLIDFDKYTDTKYFTIVNSGNSTMDFQVSTSDAFINISPSNGVLGFNEVAKIQVDISRNMLGLGVNKGSLLVSSNGGTRIIEVQVYNPMPDPPVLWWDIDYIKIAASQNSNFVTIANDGEEILEYTLSSATSWISFSQSSGSLMAGEEELVWINVDRGGLSPDLYSGLVNISSNGGNGQVIIDMEVGIYSVTFFNPTYTPIDMRVSGFANEIIPVLERMSYIFPSNPGSITYLAQTEGESVGGVTLGYTLTWDETINLSEEIAPTYDLDISDYFFFMSAKNYGAHDLDMWSINYDTEYQFDEDVLIPNDGYEYYFGYYDALDNSNVYARIVGTQYDAVWRNGYEFDFPWTNNQAILLESDQKKASDILSTRSFLKTGETQQAIQIQARTQTKIRTRNSQSLTNKR